MGSGIVLSNEEDESFKIVTDFRKMNEAIERHPFPLPRINDIMHKLEQFKSATALDLSQ